LAYESISIIYFRSFASSSEQKLLTWKYPEPVSLEEEQSFKGPLQGQLGVLENTYTSIPIMSSAFPTPFRLLGHISPSQKPEKDDKKYYFINILCCEVL
jgi:hypothetical protein